MKILAFDTSTEACSAALMIKNLCISRYEVAPRKHAELILPMIDEVIDEAGIQLKDLDAIAFGCGPGAFTGVRIATGIAQGLSFSVDLPLIPVSSLAAMAQSVNGKAEVILAAIDARMDEIYYGFYQSGNIVSLIGSEAVCKPDTIIIPEIKNLYGIGSGWKTYTDQLQQQFPNIPLEYSAEAYPDARDILAIAVQEYQNKNFIKPEQAAPAYLRNKVTG